MSQDPMKLLEDTETFIELMSGIKAKWIAAGWSSRGAEEMTAEMLRASQGKS
jgi:hypothetical protein